MLKLTDGLQKKENRTWSFSSIWVFFCFISDFENVCLLTSLTIRRMNDTPMKIHTANDNKCCTLIYECRYGQPLYVSVCVRVSNNKSPHTHSQFCTQAITFICRYYFHRGYRYHYRYRYHLPLQCCPCCCCCWCCYCRWLTAFEYFILLIDELPCLVPHALTLCRIRQTVSIYPDTDGFLIQLKLPPTMIRNNKQIIALKIATYSTQNRMLKVN